MFEQEIAAFPIQLATRLVLDSVSYSNPLPEWFEVLTVDYARREATIRGTIQQYLNGTQKPRRPFETALPKRSAQLNTWIVPSINDQIIWQTAVSAIADTVQRKAINQAKVFSCILNSDPNRLAFLNDQVRAWTMFRTETERRTSGGQAVLQIDLKDAFENIRIQSFVSFLGNSASNAAAVKLIETLLASSVHDGRGVPLMNDSLFFLGNAWFSEVDRIVAGFTSDFIRFVDDYRIFGPSKSALEAMLPELRMKLNSVGFDLNESKLKVGSAEEYLEAVSRFRLAQIEISDEVASRYIDVAVPQPDLVDPKDIYGQILKSLENPDDYLHQGFGRLQMAAIRRIRFRDIFNRFSSADLPVYDQTPSTQFVDLLNENAPTIARICELLDRFSKDGSTWRLLWVLYLSKDVEMTRMRDAKLAARLTGILDRISTSPELPAIIRLWASTPGYPQPMNSISTDQIEELHQMDYLDRGKKLYGDGAGSNRRAFLRRAWAVAGGAATASVLWRRLRSAPSAQSFYVAGVRYQKPLTGLGPGGRVKLEPESFNGKKCYAVLAGNAGKIGYVPGSLAAAWNQAAPREGWLSRVDYNAVPWKRFEVSVSLSGPI